MQDHHGRPGLSRRLREPQRIGPPVVNARVGRPRDDPGSHRLPDATAPGADIAGGLIAFHLMRARKSPVSFVFKDVKASFLKRPEDDVHFTCNDGAIIRELMERTVSTGERQEATVHVTATVPKKLGDEPVAQFELTLSLKKK